jgi:gluconolactonase
MHELSSSAFVQRARAELSRRATPRFEGRGPRFAAVVGRSPRLTQLALVDAHEGPVYDPDEHALYITTVPRPGPAGPLVAVKRLDLLTATTTVVRRDANVANGMCRDRDGTLLVCEQGTLETPARIARLDPASGVAETVVDACGGVPLNSPNDVVVRSDGTVWFTDPAYGHLQGFRPPPQAPDAVYRHDPRTGTTSVVATGLDKPNGLAFSVGEDVLYVGDNGRPHHLLAFDVHPEGLGPGRVVFTTTAAHPDGVKVDAADRIYATCPSGVEVRDAAGDVLGLIRLPGAVNHAFGGPGRNVLFITTDTAVWAAVLHARGA